MYVCVQVCLVLKVCLVLFLFLNVVRAPLVQGGGCDPFFDVRIRSNRTNKMKKVFDYKEVVKKIKNYKSKEKYVDLDCDHLNIVIRGDVKIVFWDYDRMSPPDKVCPPCVYHCACVCLGLVLAARGRLGPLCVWLPCPLHTFLLLVAVLANL
jgi:hypothetical protein